MNPKLKLKLGLTLFVLGFLGVLSLLTVSLPIGDLPDEIAQLPPVVINLLMLINPAILLLISVLVGIALFDKVNLTVPVISGLLEKKWQPTIFKQQLKYGVLLGLLAGALIMLIAYIYGFFVAEELEMLASDIELTLIARLLYGGITEELLLRFGFMTLVVWIFFKLAKRLNNSAYWTGIVIASILFAVGHFPVVFSSLSNPSLLLLSYILIANAVGGLIFGWLYWKKGLESAIIAHAFAHVAMLSIGFFIN